jgi:putative nucleotidyltransferase with HDIG domain
MLVKDGKYRVLSVTCGLESEKGSQYDSYEIEPEESVIGVKPIKMNCFTPALIPQNCKKTNAIIQITDFTERNDYFNLKNCFMVKEGKIGITPQEQELLLTKIMKELEFFTTVKDHLYLKQAQQLIDLINKNKIKYINSPAAVSHHHNYIGGLMIHTMEMIKLCNGICGLNLSLDLELLILGCIAHDLGKIHEYEIDLDNGKIKMDTVWLEKNTSHIHWGYRYMVDLKVANMCASHHGYKSVEQQGKIVNFGAIRYPSTTEENLLHQVDMISARSGLISVKDLELRLGEMTAICCVE